MLDNRSKGAAVTLTKGEHALWLQLEIAKLLREKPDREKDSPGVTLPKTLNEPRSVSQKSPANFDDSSGGSDSS
jgi:hypothetical protein